MIRIYLKISFNKVLNIEQDFKQSYLIFSLKNKPTAARNKKHFWLLSVWFPELVVSIYVSDLTHGWE
ncbi:hypothetical protein LAC02_11960 [Ligilactobacillus acidipiscis]|nr:hypothetical protein LAC02_11960 [Ligilactobacillus acidipiscis]